MTIFRHSDHSTLTLRAWEFTGSALVNLFVWLLVLGYLSPLSYMVVTSLKNREQFLDPYAPLYPAERIRFNYQGRELIVYDVPFEGGTRRLGLLKPARESSQFIDPQHPEAGIITWQGNWRSLRAVYQFKLSYSNFQNFVQSLDMTRLLYNSLAVSLLGEIGVLCSSIAVAYGFSRFRIPGGKYLFLLLIATIMIPDSITLIPTYFLYVRVLHWDGSWLPLIVPHFFSSAIFVFLLRQNFKSIPKELDEAAMLDGAGPLRILISIILPQSIPTVTTVALLHFFYAWNELRNASLYLGTAPSLRTFAFSVQTFQTFFSTPEMLQVGALVAMSAPILVLFLAQRFFMQDMVITGIEK